MATIIEFEGLGENLLTSIKAATDALKELQSKVESTNAASREGSAESAEAMAELRGEIEAQVAQIKSLTEENKRLAAAAASASKETKTQTVEVKKQTEALKDTSKATVGVAQETEKTKTGIRAFFGLLRATAEGVRDGFNQAIAENKALNKELEQSNKKGKEVKTEVGGALSEVNSEFKRLAGQVPVIGNILIALGPVGVAIGAIAGGLLAVAKNTDAGATAIDGFGRTGGIVFDKVTGSVVRFVESVQALSAEGSVLGSVFNGVGNIIGKALDPLGLFNKLLGDSVEEGQALAEAYAKLEERETKLLVVNAERERQANRLSIQLRDQTKTDEDRLKIGAELSAIEAARLKDEQDAIKERIRILNIEAEQQKANKTEVSKDTKKALAEAEKDLIDAARRSEDLTEISQNRINKIKSEAAKEEESRIAKAIARQKQLNDEQVALTADLVRRQEAAAQKLASPEESLALQRDAANKEVDILEDRLKRSNAAIGRGNALTIEQESQLAEVRFAIAVDYQRSVEELERENAARRIELITDEGQREVAAFEASLAQKVQAFEKAGASIEEIEAFQASQRTEFAQQRALQAISDEEAIALARIGAIQQGADTEDEYRRRIETLRLDTQEAFARQRLEALLLDNSKEAELLRLQTQGILNDIEMRRQDLAASAPKTSLYDILGLKLDDSQKAQFEGALKQIGASIIELSTTIIAAKQAELQAQFDSTSKIIDDQRKRRDELERLLLDELKAQEEGYASNADAIRAQIEATSEVEAKAIEDRKAIAAEQSRLAKQQVRIDAAAQASSIAVAIANAIQGYSKVPIVGVALGIAAAASIISFIASTNAKLKAASQVPQFRKGGELDGPSHESGGIALFDRRTGEHFAEAEGGEYIVNKSAAKRFKPIIEGINEGDLKSIPQAAIDHLLREAGVHVPTRVVREFVHTKQKAEESKPDRALLRKIDELTEEVRAFRSQQGNRPSTATKGNTTKTVSPQRTVTVR